jgi:hypothetical protein
VLLPKKPPPLERVLLLPPPKKPPPLERVLPELDVPPPNGARVEPKPLDGALEPNEPVRPVLDAPNPLPDVDPAALPPNGARVDDDDPKLPPLVRALPPNGVRVDDEEPKLPPLVRALPPNGVRVDDDEPKLPPVVRPAPPADDLPAALPKEPRLPDADPNELLPVRRPTLL